ncbi:hypothetical protein [Klebsiella variicola]|uniref:hypothetical protein n=1 Tax=Klebsiella variicola TaxID=244366 RepID=UPI001652BA47|nr:hypothetical protein [Klebsiella variicola]
MHALVFRGDYPSESGQGEDAKPDLKKPRSVKSANFRGVCGLIFRFPPAFLKPAAAAARWPELAVQNTIHSGNNTFN